MHIDPANGDGIDAVKKFERVGGRYVFLVNKTTKDCGIGLDTGKCFETLFDYTINLSGEINEKTGVKSFPVIGIHPAEFVYLCERVSIEKATGMAKKAIDAAGRRIVENKAVAIGEVGRPHYPVRGEILTACNDLLGHAFAAASDIGCPVQLHTESFTKKNFLEVKEMAVKAGLNPKKIIKHYSPPLIEAAGSTGIWPSLIASKENISRAKEEGNRFLMESDYIDDKKRPGAVVGPKSIARVCRSLLDAGIFDENDLIKIHKDNVEEAYDIELD
jgi:TatD-related deoxyribonuclease